MERVDYQQLLVQDLVNLDKTGELDYSPWYQRRSVWTTSQKSYLINTLHEQKPIPSLYVRYALDMDRGKTVREVVDGQQRTRAILDYCQDKFPARHPATRERRTLSQLSRKQRQEFLLTALPVGYLLGASDSDVIEIFGRINSVSKSLNAQEKRNAQFSGEFKQFCLEQAASRVDLWRTYHIFSANDIARMNEVQFISDLTLNFMEGLSALNQKKINALYGQFDECFPRYSEMTHRLDLVFDLIVDLDPSAIRDTVFNRQPIFFSLLMVLNSRENLDSRRVEDALREMDARYRLESERQAVADLEFVAASTAATHQMRHRKIRHDYICRFLG